MEWICLWKVPESYPPKILTGQLPFRRVAREESARGVDSFEAVVLVTSCDLQFRRFGLRGHPSRLSPARLQARLRDSQRSRNLADATTKSQGLCVKSEFLKVKRFRWKVHESTNIF